MSGTEAIVRSHQIRIDKERFGPWAIVSGASSGIGKEFARQLAANGLNLVLVARRLDQLERVGQELATEFGIAYRAVGLDLADEGFIDRIAQATHDLDIGLLVSNAGAVLRFGAEMLTHDREDLHRTVRLNTVAHLDLAHYIGQRLTHRGRGGVLLVSSLVGRQGTPGAADYAASKAFVLVLGESLHAEFRKQGVHVTVLLPGATATEMVRSYGVDVQTMNRMMRPLRLMEVEQVVAEGLAALKANRPTHITGRANRVMASVLPRRAFTRLMGAMSARLNTVLTGPTGVS
jgi:short-subunit dehydrogenase